MVDISTNHRWSRSTKISGKREQNTNQLQSFILICIHMSRKRFFLTFHHLFWDVLLCFLKTYQNFQSLALLCFLLNNDTCFFSGTRSWGLRSSKRPAAEAFWCVWMQMATPKSMAIPTSQAQVGGYMWILTYRDWWGWTSWMHQFYSYCSIE